MSVRESVEEEAAGHEKQNTLVFLLFLFTSKTATHTVYHTLLSAFSSSSSSFSFSVVASTHDTHQKSFKTQQGDVEHIAAAGKKTFFLFFFFQMLAAHGAKYSQLDN